MFNKLKRFTLDRESNQTKSTFIKRFKFFKDKKDRKTCLDNLMKWNSRLGKLIEKAQPAAQTITTPIERSTTGKTPSNMLIYGLKSPSSQIRILTGNLYSALSHCWKYSCSGVHEARICLNIHGAERNIKDTEAEFDFLVSDPSCRNEVHDWKEGTVMVKSVTYRQLHWLRM
jgi:hypothetical protein